MNEAGSAHVSRDARRLRAQAQVHVQVVLDCLWLCLWQSRRRTVTVRTRALLVLVASRSPREALWVWLPGGSVARDAKMRLPWAAWPVRWGSAFWCVPCGYSVYRTVYASPLAR